ncbi:MAG: DUF4397 domain-containing protein [Chitinophagaceae bacterium]|nr:DUF4397 domain-containing protein [Chitinophagaceae bacterium]
MKRNHLNAFAIGAVLFAGLTFTACKKSTFENNNPEVAGLMAVNLAFDKSIAIGINGNALTNNPLEFTNFTGGYLGVFPGTRSVDTYAYPSGDSLATASYEFEAKKYYSLFVVGANNAYQNVIVKDNFDSLSASSGKAYVRYINAINGSVNPTITVSSGGSNVINGQASFAVVSDFVAVAPGESTITVTDGTSVNLNRSVTFEDKKVYTILLTSGATSAEPAQIKYVVNGVLDEETGQRTISSAQVVDIK